MRKHYIDNIRWLTVVLVLIYHVFYLYNAVGVLGGVGSFSAVQYQDGFLYFVYPWFMVLLFVLAGIGARYALEHKSAKQFLKERTIKLLVPSTLGLFVFQWMVGYLNIKLGGAWDTIPSSIRYLVMALAGTGPLWFIQMLWVFSVLLVLIRKLDRSDKLYALCEKCNLLVVLLLFAPLWAAAQILNTPIITTYRFGIYFTAFLIGYFLLSHDAVQEKIQKIHLPMLLLALAMGIAYTIYYFGQNYTEDPVLKSIFTNLYLWVAVLAILGSGKKWLNSTSPFSAYMTKSSFGIYIVHYLVTLAVCSFMKAPAALPVFLIYSISVVLSVAGSVALYELLKRIPVVRFWVLGAQKGVGK